MDLKDFKDLENQKDIVNHTSVEVEEKDSINIPKLLLSNIFLNLSSRFQSTVINSVSSEHMAIFRDSWGFQIQIFCKTVSYYCSKSCLLLHSHVLVEEKE